MVLVCVCVCCVGVCVCVCGWCVRVCWCVLLCVRCVVCVVQMTALSPDRRRTAQNVALFFPPRRRPEREKKTREDPQREKKRTKMEAGEGKKSAKFWASHPSGSHPSGLHKTGPKSAWAQLGLNLFKTGPNSVGPNSVGPDSVGANSVTKAGLSRPGPNSVACTGDTFFGSFFTCHTPSTSTLPMSHTDSTWYVGASEIGMSSLMAPTLVQSCMRCPASPRWVLARKNAFAFAAFAALVESTNSLGQIPASSSSQTPAPNLMLFLRHGPRGRALRLVLPPASTSTALDRHVDDDDLLVIVRVLRLNLGVIDGHLVDIHGCWQVCHGYLVGD